MGVKTRHAESALLQGNAGVWWDRIGPERKDVMCGCVWASVKMTQKQMDTVREHKQTSEKTRATCQGSKGKKVEEQYQAQSSTHPTCDRNWKKQLVSVNISQWQNSSITDFNQTKWSDWMRWRRRYIFVPMLPCEKGFLTLTYHDHNDHLFLNLKDLFV